MSLPVRATDPQTSRDAAATAVTRRPLVRDAILRVLGLLEPGTGYTHDLLHEALRRWHDRDPKHWPAVSPSGVRTRVSELVREGLVEPVPDAFGRSMMGNRAHEWRLVR